MPDHDVSDEQLVVSVRQDDKNLFGEIIRRYERKLTHYLRKFIRDPDELEDVLQAVFIKSYQNLYGFDVHKKFSSWVYRIAHNEAINHLKKQSKRGISLDEFELQLIDEKIDLPTQVDLKLNKEKTEQALAHLKDKYREPIILYFFEQKSYEEISDILRVPVATVGTLLARGKQKLKTFLEH